MIYKISVYVPESHIDVVKAALFAVGAGQLGFYDHCCWQTLGTGEYRPLKGSNPTVGKEGVISSVPEYLLEIPCKDIFLHAAIEALKKSHPYEEMGYHVSKTLDITHLK